MMGRRLVGSLLFLGAATFLFEIAGRLASEERSGWGWFVFAGLMLSGIAHNVWTGEFPESRGKELALRDGWNTE
jgi:hypothetical protein